MFLSRNKSPQFAGRHYGDAKLLFSPSLLGGAVKVKYLIDLVTRVYALARLAELSRRSKHAETVERIGGWKRTPELHCTRRILQANFRMWGDILVFSRLAGPGKLSGTARNTRDFSVIFRSRSNDTPLLPKEFRRPLKGCG